MVITNKYTELAKRIYSFLDEYAGISPNYDPEYDDENDKYTSPDASTLKYCADTLRENKIPVHCFSEWGSGGYHPYTSKKGRYEHDYIITEIYKIIHDEKNR